MSSERSIKSSITNQSGQLSIFLGMVMVMIISLLGFVVNVGLFVHAKINLQNAVDAAAYSGAATQARLLTQMGYLNWEIRNNYKEWLFKYYVVGTLSNSKLTGQTIAGDFVDFRPKPFLSDPNSSIAGIAYDETAFSKFNVPSVCINFGDTNICDITGIPGLPRFETVGMPAISEAHEQFLNKMVASKASDCSDRSNLNFGTAMAWTFGIGGDASTPQPVGTPPILIHLPGSWIKSIELAIRMRNLEMIINRPPITGAICRGGNNCTEVSTLAQESGQTPYNERPVKAFLSAYKNLGGGRSGSSSLRIKQNFRMTELKPVPIVIEPNDLSGLFINTGASFPSEGVFDKKYYADLIITPVNYLIFFTSFVGETAGGTDIQAEGACASSLTGIPVPGFIMGFVKSNRAITYYAVKGETKYLGLFYPFTEDEGITLRAYAAAKPFGGRIGPYLFKYAPTELNSRSGDTENKTVSYMSALHIDTSSGYEPGLPIPFDDTFYVSDDAHIVGGVPSAQSGNDVRFGIPNMIYDVLDNMPEHVSSAGLSAFMPIATWTGTAAAESAPTGASYKGLYKPDQFKALQSSLKTMVNISAAELNDAVIKAKRPTKYDALNYLIPIFDEKEVTQSFDSISAINRERSDPEVTVSGILDFSYIRYNLFAPLTGPYNYPDIGSVNSKVQEYLTAVETSVKKFLDSLKDVAEQMRTTSTHSGTGTTGGDNYADAANAIHPQNDTPLDEIGGNLTPEQCKRVSLAGRFAYFFNTSASSVEDKCGIVPIMFNVMTYLHNTGTDSPTFYRTTYAIPEDPASLLTAYSPGPRQGATSDGDYELPFKTSDSTVVTGGRNYYSTKLIAINKVLSPTSETAYNKEFVISEDATSPSISINPKLSQMPNYPNEFANSLEQGVIEEHNDFDDF